MSLREIVGQTTQFIDVRTEDEFATGHIEGALNIPLAVIAERKQEIKGLGEIPVVFYCRSGNRSGIVVSYLQRQGFGHVYNGGSLEEVRQLLKNTTR